jgi:hypothetical protein
MRIGRDCCLPYRKKQTEEKPMTAYEFLLYLSRNIPLPPVTSSTGFEEPSNRELKRWLENKSVLINGQRPGPKDTVSFPINSLSFFPKGRVRTYR